MAKGKDKGRDYDSHAARMTRERESTSAYENRRMRADGGETKINHNPGGGGRFGDRKEARRERAIVLAKARAGRTPRQQLALLDERLGMNIGAVSERARLNREIRRTDAAVKGSS